MTKPKSSQRNYWMPQKKGDVKISYNPKIRKCPICKTERIIESAKLYLYKLRRKGRWHYYCSNSCWRKARERSE